MTLEEFNFILEDRVSKIKAIDEQLDLQHNSYIAFSGGKDSVVLSHLIDIALPDNNIPRVFTNTGIEYKAIVKYVKSLADPRIVILNQTKNTHTRRTNTMKYRLIGKEKLTGNIIYTPWYLATTLIEVVANQMKLLSNLAYNINIEYKEAEV